MQKSIISRKVKFKILKIEDIRKHGSTVEVNKVFSGIYYPSNNCIQFTDINNQDWSFSVGDTCIIVYSEEPNTSSKDYKIIYKEPKKILYNSPTAKVYTLENGCNELKESVIIGEDDHSYFVREVSPNVYTGIHKSRLVSFLSTGIQLTIF